MSRGRTKQGVSNPQLYRAVGLFLYSGKSLSGSSIPYWSNSQTSRITIPHVSSQTYTDFWSHFSVSGTASSVLHPFLFPGCLCACREHYSPMLVPLPVWHSAGLTGICTRVTVAGHTIVRAWGCIFSCELHFIVTEHGDKTLFVFELFDLNFNKILYFFPLGDFFSLHMGNFILRVKVYWLRAGRFFSLFAHIKLGLCKCSWKGHEQ